MKRKISAGLFQAGALISLGVVGVTDSFSVFCAMDEPLASCVVIHV